MKINLTFFIGILFSFYCFSQPDIQWQKTWGGIYYSTKGYSIKQTNDGGYIVGGYYDDVAGNHGNYFDYWIVKLSATGAIQWEKLLGGFGEDGAQSIQQTSDGGYVVAGWSDSTDGDVTGNHGFLDYWIVKLSETGSIQWQKTLGGSLNDEAFSLQQTADGGYIVAGRTTSTDSDVTGNHGNKDCWIVKLNATGTIQWQKALGGSLDDEANSIQQTTDGGYILAGWTTSTDGDITGYHGLFDYWIVKLNTTGTIQWQKALGGSGYDVANSIQQTTDGGYIIAGETNSNNGDVTGLHDNLSDYWIVKLNATGVIEWQKALGGSANDSATSIQQTTDGGYIVAGWSRSSDGDVVIDYGNIYDDYWIVKLNATGTIQWQKVFGDNGNDGAQSIQQTTDSGYILSGYSKPSFPGLASCSVIKLGADPLSISSFQQEDMTIYPNPTSNKITLHFNAQYSENAVIKISDMTGKIVFSRLYQIENEHLEMDVASLTSGIYLLNIQSPEFSHTEKLIITK